MPINAAYDSSVPRSRLRREVGLTGFNGFSGFFMIYLIHLENHAILSTYSLKHSMATSGRALFPHSQPQPPAMSPRRLVRAAPAPTPGPNRYAHGPTCRRESEQ